MSAAAGFAGNQVMASNQDPNQAKLFKTTYFYDRQGNMHQRQEAESSMKQRAMASQGQRPFY